MSLATARAAEQARALRVERTSALTERLKAGDFDAARYESTPRRRAERLAEVLNRCLSRGAMKRRLKSLGVAPEFCGAALMAVSVEGGGIDVRRADGQGQVLTGPGLDERLLGVFPELVPFTLRNLTYFAAAVGPTVPGHRNTAFRTWTTGDPLAFDEDSEEAWDLSLFLTSYTATDALIGAAAIGRLTTVPFCSQNLLNVVGSSTYINVAYADMNAQFPGNCAFTNIRNFGIYYQWPADGVNWCNTHAEQAYAVVGPIHFEATLVNGITAWSPVDYGFQIQQLQITYTDTGCDTCTLDLQVNSDCDGSLVDGGVFDLGNGLTCTQVDGTCSISGISHGTYSWAWEKSGYTSQSGTFECECAGGSSTLFLSVSPVGGCDGTATVETVVVDYCAGTDLSGVLIALTGDDVDEECTTGGDGTCTFENIPAGDYTLAISKSGYQTQVRTFTTTGAPGVETVTITVSLIPDGGCDGVDPCMEPLSFGPPLDKGLLFHAQEPGNLVFAPPLDKGIFFVSEGHA